MTTSIDETYRKLAAISVDIGNLLTHVTDDDQPVSVRSMLSKLDVDVRSSLASIPRASSLGWDVVDGRWEYAYRGITLQATQLSAEPGEWGIGHPVRIVTRCDDMEYVGSRAMPLGAFLALSAPEWIEYMRDDVYG